jgi:dihydroorotate dehydrogenase
MDSALSRQLARSIKEGLGATPLLIKVGRVPREDDLHDLLESLAGAADGVTLVNGVTMPVLHRDGRPAFGPRYLRAGVAGRGIHRVSVEQVARGARWIRQRKLPLSLAAVGGVSCQEDAADFFRAGADAVLMGSSPMYLPGLACDAKRQHPDW